MIFTIFVPGLGNLNILGAPFDTIYFGCHPPITTLNLLPRKLLRLTCSFSGESALFIYIPGASQLNILEILQILNGVSMEDQTVDTSKLITAVNS
ncbi:TPA: hypothetical protein QCS32_005844 [Bacillus thuringiensis]|uniref:Uncharacterized protein n=4 Tax=Bacteria TaxID=2 RepID=A0A9X6QKV4_BACTU|nr:hypothetical protein [Bacillus thuringiensis]MEB9624974.1 hypothetical protein [Bacillus cereus]OTW56023.1 hypothetical protein BK699_00115 [Bacillus thuringiensis serovar mexicanensis]OUB42789.1 hypothetical protein BK741_24605 [Bacillus thuringiensis serovar iberica]HDR5354046.1 hypothetical protein [Bacillus thuringiensis]